MTTSDYLNEEIKHLRVKLNELSGEVAVLQLRIAERDEYISRLLDMIKTQQAVVRIPIKDEVQ